VPQSHTLSSYPSRESETDHDIADGELIGVSGEHRRVERIAVAAVFAALSAAVSPIASMLPRIPGWGIALFDPVSLFWIIAFLIGGIGVGMVSTAGGTVCLFFFDPTGIGPIFKFLATVPMIVVPWLGAKRYGRELGGQFLERPLRMLRYGNYAFLMVAAFFVRLLLMIPLNLVLVPFLYGPYFTTDFIITYAFILNAIQSLWDALVPCIVVYPTGVYDHFKMW
jgi:hypothetical protein